VAHARFFLLLTLGLFAAGFVALWVADLIKIKKLKPEAGPAQRLRPGGIELLIGFVTNFFDTLGIGSYAQQTSLFKIFRLVPDELIPGTLNIGDTIPTFLEAFAFMAAVEVGAKTLILMIAASILGAWLGAGIVASLPKRKIQIGMGAALLAAAAFFLMSNLGLFPAGGATQNLSGPLLALGLAGNFVLGALMTLGIGLYAPCMVLVSLLGMNPQAAFPIMMGSCAFLMPVASPRFMQKRRYSPGTALALALGGIPGVLIAAYIVKSLPLKVLRWLVIAVVTYTAAAMLRSAAAGD